MQRFWSALVLCSAACLFTGCGADTETDVMEAPDEQEMEEIDEMEMQMEGEANDPQYR